MHSGIYKLEIISRPIKIEMQDMYSGYSDHHATKQLIATGRVC